MRSYRHILIWCHDQLGVLLILTEYEDAALKTQTSLSALNLGQNVIFSAALSTAMIMCGHGILEGTMSIGDLVCFESLHCSLHCFLNFCFFHGFIVVHQECRFHPRSIHPNSSGFFGILYHVAKCSNSHMLHFWIGQERSCLSYYRNFISDSYPRPTVTLSSNILPSLLIPLFAKAKIPLRTCTAYNLYSLW